MPEPVAPLTGRCMCGAVELAIAEPLLEARYCHCTRCQRRTGSAFAASGLTRPGAFSITRGAEVVREYSPGDGGWAKAFCGECGSALYAAPPDSPDQVVVRLGVIDQDPGVRPSAHQFVAYAAPWEPIPDDGLPRYDERMPS